MHKSKEEIKELHGFEVNGQLVELEGKLVFNWDSGTFVVSMRWTTKLVSPDEKQREALHSATKNILEVLYKRAWELRAIWAEQNEEDPDQLSIFESEFGPDNEDADNGPDDENGDIDESAMSLSMTDSPTKRGRK